MNDDNFKKLDAFMERNVPQMSNVPALTKIKHQNRFGILEYVFALGLSCIIGFTVINHENKKLESASALSEVLEWDPTLDDDSLEVVTPEDFEI